MLNMEDREGQIYRECAHENIPEKHEVELSALFVSLFDYYTL